MKTILFCISLCLASSLSLYSQIPKRIVPENKNITTRSSVKIDMIVNVEQFINNNIFSRCIQISNISVKGGFSKSTGISFALWNDTTNHIGISSGIIMSTGNAFDINAPSDYFANTDLGTEGDTLLNFICGGITNNATSFEFDFIPSTDTISYKFIFGSEEYHSYVNTQFNDVFGFFVTGPNPNGGDYVNYNSAMVPNTNIPITINTINNGQGSPCSTGPCENCAYFHDNCTDTVLAFNGRTVVMQPIIYVIPGQSYHFKAVIADVSDGSFDSAVILALQSFGNPVPLPSPSFVYTQNRNYSIQFTNTTPNSQYYTYLWDFGDGTSSTESSPLHVFNNPQAYLVKLSAFGPCDTITFEQNIDVTTGNLLNSYNEITMKTINPEGLFAFENVRDISNATVYSLTGKKISNAVTFSNNRLEINLINEPQGMYILNLGSVNFKMVK